MLFKDRLRKLRISNDLTQKDLAKKINASQSKIGMWEIGSRDPGTDDIFILSKYFNVSSDYLLGLSDEPNLNRPKKITNFLDNDELELISLFRNLPQREKIKAIGKIEDMVKTFDDDFTKNNVAQSTSSQKDVG